MRNVSIFFASRGTIALSDLSASAGGLPEYLLKVE